MASALIHMAVAKRINEVLKLEDEKQFLFGAISPDIAKIVGMKRCVTHYCNDGEDTPHLDRFLAKYKDQLKNPYELGFYVHLVTDKLWFEEFLPNFCEEGCLIDKSGHKLKFPQEELSEIIYNDYSNVNSEVLSYYNIDMSLFYENFEFPENHIEEINTDDFPKIVEKLGTISTQISNYSYLFDIERITHFIEYAVIYCLDEIKKIRV